MYCAAASDSDPCADAASAGVSATVSVASVPTSVVAHLHHCLQALQQVSAASGSSSSTAAAVQQGASQCAHKLL